MMRALLLAGIMTAGWVAPVVAVPISASYDVNATFRDGPNPTVFASVSLSFNTETLGAITVNAFASDVLATYIPVTADEGPDTSILVSNNCVNANCSVSRGKNQFFFDLNSSGDVLPGGAVLIYATPAPDSPYVSSSISVTREAVTVVPEPASFALMMVGVAGVFGMRRLRAQ